MKKKKKRGWAKRKVRACKGNCGDPDPNSHPGCEVHDFTLPHTPTMMCCLATRPNQWDQPTMD
jgi:hypothetical protein